MIQKKNQNQQPKDGQQQNSEELINSLKERFSFPINVMSHDQLEARMMAELESEAWQGKRQECNDVTGTSHAPLCWRGYYCWLSRRAPHDDK